MEFNFKSYDYSKQAISYCEVDKCKAVIKLKKCLQEVKGLCQSMTDEFEEMDIEQQLCYCQQISKQILQKISECEGNDE